MEANSNEVLPLCAKCGKPVPVTNNVLTILRLCGDSCIGQKDCHMDPVQSGSSLCPGARDVVRNLSSDQLRRLLAKMRNITSSNDV